jgi:ligand-binding SRPBCC domain-containing protein
MYVLTCEMKTPVPIEQAFAVFESPYNLARITPKWLNFRIATPGKVIIRKGAEIEYQIKWLGIPMSWKTIISEYEPPHFFEDFQVKGPYSYWRHRHTFRAVEGGTVVGDRVEYALPLGPLGRIANSLAVARQLRGIFEHRGRTLAPLIGGDPAAYEFSPVIVTAK